MNDKYIIVKDSFENVMQDDGVQAFQFRIRIPHFQGVPFSQINYIRALIDGEEVPQQDMRVVAATGEIFRMDELSTCDDYFWEYGEQLRVRVMRGGLAKGPHHIEVLANVAVIFTPAGFGSRSWTDFEMK